MTYRQPREMYEGRYDRLTVELCRNKEDMLRSVYRKAKEKGLPKLTGKDKDKNPEVEMIRVLNLYHYMMVDMLAGEHWEKRTESIEKWMAEDDAKDEHVRSARLTEEPVCGHCGKTGLRIVSKDLLGRDQDHEHELVLFMLECTHCEKRSAVWEDGKAFEVRKQRCPQCQSEMDNKSQRSNKVITFTYTCPTCGHKYQEKLDLNIKKEKEEPDPHWEEDKARFVLTDKQGHEYLEAKHNLEGMKKLMDDIKERERNKDLYDAIAAMKKVNIGQLTELLQPAIEKAGYTELSFDKPEMGQHVFVGFNCLDSKSERAEYDSRKSLKKVVINALEDTNWRLMSDGIDYRLGYLNGRLRAYEGEDEMLKLVNSKLSVD